MIANIRTLFCKWTPWETLVLRELCNPLAAEHRRVIETQLQAINKIQRIVGWTEIDFYVTRKGRVCWDGVPMLNDTSEFLLAKASTRVGNVTIESELTCISGHLFSIESDAPVKPHAFQSDMQVKILTVDKRYEIN
ncbi:MAG: hypothetical protein RLZZ350_142 [Verrucomicrobiota bacterium]|jgi:hypothetical protein